MKFFLLSFFLFFCFLSPFVLLAQRTNDLSDSHSKDETSSYLKADINYLSNSVYNGRKDSLPVPYITPTLGYYHKSGLFAEASLSVLASNYAFRPDLFILDGGYNFNIGDNFSGSVSASKYASNKQSVSVRSEIKGTTDVAGTYNMNDIVKINAGGSLVFSSSSPDVLTNAGISHEFDLGNDDEWSIEPTFTTNLGTQNYFDNYQKNRTTKTGTKKKKITSQAGIVTTTNVLSLHPKRFVLLDYEISAPLYYDATKWGAYFIPTFSIPESPDTYSVTTTTIQTLRDGTVEPPIVKQSQVNEKIQNSFYVQVGVYFVFK